ncbi:unnamed protein product [Didymodactylos carnosus]|nr:unnamed protein product [Didymodactylos carnosus]CAF4391872.1 unnamed protein product [Didymodactylos carnosus]
MSELNYPRDVVLDSQQNLYVADYSRPQKYFSNNGISVTVVSGDNGLGNASNQLYYPQGIFIDEINEIGAIYVVDPYNHIAQKWLPGGDLWGNYVLQRHVSQSIIVDTINNIIYVSDSVYCGILQ